jgi:hypothetical protein
MSAPHRQTLRQAFELLEDAAGHGRWEAALEAAVTARAAVDWLIADDPELPADIWIDPEDQDRLARATTLAIDADHVDVAARLLDASPGETLCSRLEEGRAAVRALRAGDPELSLAVLATSYSAYGESVAIQMLLVRVAERTAVALDAGTWEQRMLGVVAVGLAVGDDGYGAFEAKRAREVDWAAARNLHSDRDLLAYVLATVCVRRRGATFEVCAAKYGGELFTVARELFDEVVAGARRQLGAGTWSSTFSTFALGAVLDGRDAELRDRTAALSAASKGRAGLLSRTVEDAHRRVEEWRSSSPPAPLERPSPCAAEVLGTFDLESGIVTVGDPGYTDACLRFHVPVVGVKQGTWLATVVRSEVPDEGTRCAFLLAHHVAHPCSIDDPIWLHQGSIDVEYASAGIFECARYYDERVVAASVDTPREGEHPWYDMCLTRAHGTPGRYDDRGAGTVPFGCVSASGRGDGSYECFASRATDRTVVALCIEFAFADAEA